LQASIYSTYKNSYVVGLGRLALKQETLLSSFNFIFYTFRGQWAAAVIPGVEKLVGCKQIWPALEASCLILTLSSLA
jgi:hypothetical protein